jgi:membrane protease subunit HflC
MNSVKGIVFALVAVVSIAVVSGTLFTVRQTEQAIVVRLGNPVRVESEPGLHFKIPIAESIVMLDARILDLDPPGQDMVLIDQRRINVDSFARYKIIDPLKFIQSVPSEVAFRDRFGNILNGAVRDRVGRADLRDLLGTSRAQIMLDIADVVRRRAPEFGIEVLEVRIGRTDLTEQVLQATFNRMRSDRTAEAADYRGRGQEAKSRIEAEADAERTIILAEAEKESQILLGDGEAQSRLALNKAHGQDPEFYSFFRTMEAYRSSMGSGTTMVLSPNSEFFKYFNQLPGSRK